VARVACDASVTISIDRRTKIVGLALLAAAVLWAGWRWLQHYEYANFPPSAEGPWVALGDSLTEGYGASEGHDYPRVLGEQLGIQIVNKGRSGDTTADGLARLEDVLKLKPRVVLLCLGGNDELQKLPRSQMRDNLARIIDQLRERGSFVVLIGVRSATLRDQNKKLFRNLAREKRVFHVPNILEGIFARPIYMSDALHPNDAGYGRIAERLEQELRPLLVRLNGS
jgi:acyl-CoA thioesterase I